MPRTATPLRGGASLHPLTAALAQLTMLEAEQAGQLAKTREAIAAVSRLTGQPAVAAPAAVSRRRGPYRRLKGARASAAARPVAVGGDPHLEAVRAALKNGPLLVAEVRKRTKLSRVVIAGYVRAGLIVGEGSTCNRRLSLPGQRHGGAAKEAP